MFNVSNAFLMSKATGTVFWRYWFVEASFDLVTDIDEKFFSILLLFAVQPIVLLSLMSVIIVVSQNTTFTACIISQQIIIVHAL